MPVFQTYRRVLVKKISESTCLKTSRRDNVHSQLRAFFAKGGSCGVRTRHLKDQPVYPRRPFNTAEREWFLERELPETYSEDQERHRPHMKPRYDWRKRAYSRKIRDRGRDPNLSEEFRYVARVRPNDKQGCRLSSANMGYSEVLAKRDYLKKFLPLINAEEDLELGEVRNRLATWSKEQLCKEGKCLFGLYAFWAEESRMGSPIGIFRCDRAVCLPKHDFKKGTEVILSREHPLKEQTKRGRVECVSNEELHIIFEERFPVDEGRWRLDLSPDSPVYERMRDALDYLGDDPSVYEMDELNSHWKERVLCGTSLRDVILRSFLRPGPISVETHNPQNTHGRESGSQSSTNEHMRGVFRNDMRIMSWARRYSKEKPVIVEGDPDLGALNSSQLRAIAMMVGERVSLIQGPPGTGKTRAIVEAINLLKAHFEVPHPILVCSYANLAADTLLEGFIDAGLHPIRVGQSCDDEHLQKYHFSEQFKAHGKSGEYDDIAERLQKCRDNLRELQRKITELEGNGVLSREGEVQLKNMRAKEPVLMRQECVLTRNKYVLRQKITRDILMRADVICTTCISSASFELNAIDFPVVFLDEATMSTEPVSLIPLMKGCDHLVLIGDHKQLPPVIKSKTAKQGGLEISMFERLLQEGHVPTIMLDTQYRMHPNISEFPSSEFYGSELFDGTVNADGHTLPSLAPPICRYIATNPISHIRPVTFIDHRGPEHQNSRSKANRLEAYIVCCIVEELLLHNPDLDGHDIGVITPYMSQINHISRLLKKDKKIQDHFVNALPPGRAIEVANIEVKTVDGFQGREKDVIIFSTVRNNEEGYIGFLADGRRLNVGLTRAKRALFVIGNRDTLEKGKFGRGTNEGSMSKELKRVYDGAASWRRYIDYLTREGLVVQLKDESIRGWYAEATHKRQRA